MAADAKQEEDIRKFEEIGTHAEAGFLAIAEALTFHQGIGAARKEARLCYLRNYWAERLLQHDRVRLNTSLKPGFACGIASFRIKGVDCGQLSGWLWRDHRILTTTMKHADFEGVRVSPNVYTQIEELDRFVECVEQVLRRGLPGAKVTPPARKVVVTLLRRSAKRTAASPREKKRPGAAVVGVVAAGAACCRHRYRNRNRNRNRNRIRDRSRLILSDGLLESQNAVRKCVFAVSAVPHKSVDCETDPDCDCDPDFDVDPDTGCNTRALHIQETVLHQEA